MKCPASCQGCPRLDNAFFIEFLQHASSDKDIRGEHLAQELLRVLNISDLLQKVILFNNDANAAKQELGEKSGIRLRVRPLEFKRSCLFKADSCRYSS